MNIQMDESRNLHWSDDPDLLERFVLNRLELEEREQLETHLRVCELCQQAVRSEQELAAGARRLGREGLKLRLKHRLAYVPQRHLAWQPIASAAVVIVIIIGIGIYNHWFTFLEPGRMSTVEERTLKEAKTRSGDDEMAKIEKSTTEEKFQQDSEAPPVASSKSETTSGRMELRRDEDVRAQSQNRGQAAYSAAERAAKRFNEKDLKEEILPQGGREIGAVTLGQKMKRDSIRPLLEASDEAVPTTRSLWLEGTILPTAEREGMKEFERAAGADDVDRSLRKSERAPDDSKLAHELPSPLKVSLQMFRLGQRLASSLPSSRQKEVAQTKSQVVQTLLEQTGDRIQMTLYLDSLVDDRDLENAHLQLIGEDSLVVDLADQRIGYRLPSGWKIRKATKVEQQK